MDGQSPPVVLVADDDAGVRLLLRAYLTPGYQVLEAEDGEAALDLLARQPVDLLLLDVMMPHLDGLQVVAHVRRQPDAPWLPVIMLSALYHQEDRNVALASGADDFLSKPVDRQELLLRVRYFLKIKQRLEAVEQDEARRRKQAHDIRNALTGAMAALRSVRLGLEGSPSTELCADVEEALEHLQRVRSMVQQPRPGFTPPSESPRAPTPAR